MAAEFTNNGMHMINLAKLSIDAYNPWSSVCYLIVVSDFFLSVVAYSPYLTCRIQSVADDASYDSRPSVFHLIVVFLFSSLLLRVICD